MAEIPRRPDPRRFLDASLAPLDRALRERARTLNELAEQATPDGHTPFPPVATGPEFVRLTRFIAQQFTDLAEELHHW